MSDDNWWAEAQSTHDPNWEQKFVAETLVRTWAEEVLRRAQDIRQQRETFRAADLSYDRMEDWTLTERDLARMFREQWAAEHSLVWATNQLEVWKQRYAEEQDQPKYEPHPDIKRVRNVLEHLNEVNFVDGYAKPKNPKRDRALTELGHLSLAQGRGDGLFVDDLTLEVIEEQAHAALAEDQAREQAEIEDYLINQARGK